MTSPRPHQTEWSTAPPAEQAVSGQMGPTSSRSPADHTLHGSAHASHGGSHMWMMLVMCLPLVAVGLWSLVNGGGVGRLLGGVACMAMMMLMHRSSGTGHRH